MNYLSNLFCCTLCTNPKSQPIVIESAEHSESETDIYKPSKKEIRKQNDYGFDIPDDQISEYININLFECKYFTYLAYLLNLNYFIFCR